MSGKRREAGGAITDSDEVDGPDAYTAGGFTIQTNVGRADDYDVNIDTADYEARVTGVNNKNELNVQVYAQDGTGEVAADTDLSGATFRYSATRL